MLAEEVEPCRQSSIRKAFLRRGSGIWVVLSSIVLIVDSQSLLSAILSYWFLVSSRDDIYSTSVARRDGHWHRLIEIWLGRVLLAFELLHVFNHLRT